MAGGFDGHDRINTITGLWSFPSGNGIANPHDPAGRAGVCTSV